jgi:hypothetical protein
LVGQLLEVILSLSLPLVALFRFGVFSSLSRSNLAFFSYWASNFMVFVDNDELVAFFDCPSED